MQRIHVYQEYMYSTEEDTEEIVLLDDGIANGHTILAAIHYLPQSTPIPIHIVTSISGVEWDEVIMGSVQSQYGTVPVRYIGREQYITNKKACGRKRDLADIEALGEE